MGSAVCCTPLFSLQSCLASGGLDAVWPVVAFTASIRTLASHATDLLHSLTSSLSKGFISWMISLVDEIDLQGSIGCLSHCFSHHDRTRRELKQRAHMDHDRHG